MLISLKALLVKNFLNLIRNKGDLLREILVPFIVVCSRIFALKCLQLKNKILI